MCSTPPNWWHSPTMSSINDVSHLPPRSLHYILHYSTLHFNVILTLHALCTLTGTHQRHLPPASSLSAHSQEHKAHLNDISHLPPRSLHTHRNTRHTSMTSPTSLPAHSQEHLNNVSHLPPRSLHTHRNTSTTSPTCHLAPYTLTGTPQWQPTEYVHLVSSHSKTQHPADQRQHK